MKDAAQPDHVLLVSAAGECAWNMTVLKNKSVFYLTQNIHEEYKKAHQKRTADDQRQRTGQKMPGPHSVWIWGML